MAKPPLQIHRTDSSGPPTGLAEGQLSVEMNLTPPALWVGVPTALDPSGRKLINVGADALPRVQRIRIAGHQIWVEFDNPCPYGCYLQFWRFRRSYKSGESHRYEFRRVQVIGPRGAHLAMANTNTGGFPLRPIPVGHESILAGSTVECFRPPVVRRSYRTIDNNTGSANLHNYSRYFREGSTGWPKPGDAGFYSSAAGASHAFKRGMKCILKFAIYQHYRPATWPVDHAVINYGMPSTETLTIQRWKYNTQVGTPYWGLKVDVS
jgi:hypothetical protein